MPEDEDSGIFSRSPRGDRCALCARPGERFAWELRPTGAAGRRFKYPLCETCRRVLSEQASDTSPDVLAYHLRFLQIVFIPAGGRGKENALTADLVL